MATIAKKIRQPPQAQRFIDAARDAGCSEDEAEVRETMKRIAAVKVAKPDASKQ